MHLKYFQAPGVAGGDSPAFKKKYIVERLFSGKHSSEMRRISVGESRPRKSAKKFPLCKHPDTRREVILSISTACKTVLLKECFSI